MTATGHAEARRPAVLRRTSTPVSIAYEVRGGEEPVLVMVHGLGYGRWGWGGFADLLAKERCLALVDNRGIGDSDAPPGPYSVSEMAGDVAAVLDDLALERCDLLGASLGGMIALELALAQPERFEHLVLLATTAGDHGVPLPASTRNLLRGGVTVTAETTRRLVAGALSPSTLERNPALVDELLDLREEHPQDPAAWRAQAAASDAFSASRSLSDYSGPTLVVAGRDDAVIDPAASEHLARALPNAELQLLEGLGHLSFFEAPELLADVVGGFLGRPPGLPRRRRPS